MMPSTSVVSDRPGWFGLPRTVWRLGLTSLFTDTASEAIYPLLPVFLSRVLGATAFSLGVIEGLAEGVNSLLKVASGYVSDRWRRQPIVVAGYGLSSAVRPLTAIVWSWPQLLAIRLTDRVGKGIRGAPRDAILAAWAQPGTRGRIFGFHRAMDHVGAMVGPSLAALFLFAFPGQYRTLFALTAIPGAIAVSLLFGVREEPAWVGLPAPAGTVAGPAAGQRVPRPESAAGGVTWSALSGPFRSYLGVLLLFTLGNSSDAFLLLRFTDLGLAAAAVPLVWAALHVVKALFSIAGGALSDRLGRRPVIVAGWMVYAGVYAGFAATGSVTVLLILFLVYGLYYGLTEATEKALVADLVPAGARGTAFGFYNAVVGAGSMGASLVFGALWTWVGPAVAFGLGAGLALLASALLFLLVPGGPRRGQS